MDEITLTLNNPFTEEEWDMIADVDLDHTSEVLFHTKHGKKVRFVKEPQWIPCSERLPKEEEKSYWVCTDGGYQCQCRWTNIDHFWTYLTTEWHWHIVDVPQYSKVVAWMPLPSLWEGEKDDI